MRILLLIAAASLAACSAERPPDQPREAPGEANGPPTTGAPPAPPPAQGLPGLLPLHENEIAALGPGARCSLSDGGPVLMVARIGKAIANDRGTLVALAPRAEDRTALRDGGRFEAAGLAIEVAAGMVVRRGPAGVTRDASASVIREGRGYSISHGPRWTCRW